MSTLRDRLALMVDGMPPGSAVTLPTDWLKAELERERVSQVDGDQLLTLQEVAERVGRAVSTVRSWCNEGKLEGAFRLRGRDWRVPETALKAFLDAEKAPSKVRTVSPAREATVSSWRQIRQRKGKVA